MTNHLLPPASGSPSLWHDALTTLGFKPDNGGYRRQSMRFKHERRWFTLEDRSPSTPEDILLHQAGLCGLWRWIPDGDRAVRVFEFPERAVSGNGDDDWADEEEHPASPEAFLTWVIASERGDLPTGWRAPEQTLVESWLPAGGLTIQCGPLLRQGELMVSPERWSLRFPLLTNLPATLPASRRHWLTEVLTDGLARWRMVRLGVSSAGELSAVHAEVNLSGAPPSEPLFSAGLDAIRNVVQWLAEPLELLADATVASELLAGAPYRKPE